LIFEALNVSGWQVLTTVVASFAVCVIVVAFSARLPQLSGRSGDLHAVQSTHSKPTPRVGGIAIFCALGLSTAFAPLSVATSYTYFTLATSVLFFTGLAEDLGFHIAPRWRLLAAAASSLLVVILLDAWLPRVGIPWLDTVVPYASIGVPLTLLVTAGIANGFNLIDGVNGLASLTAIVAAVALNQVAANAGYVPMTHLTIMFAAGLLGFFLVNYPFGFIFLGDAGAYTIGFVLSWFGIAILLNAPGASPWAILLTMYWPVADTMLAIWRRTRRTAIVSAPDRLHVHQMVMRGLESCLLGRKRRQVANPLTTLILAPFIIMPPVSGVLLWDQNFNAFLAVVIFGVSFFASYAAAPSLIRKYRMKKFDAKRPQAVDDL
jgi:UDP-N-acetylmuramyl pentapeptide phosphotransferase/UDP-N-acetylglucosamine-1-phosphate transferase